MKSSSQGGLKPHCTPRKAESAKTKHSAKECSRMFGSRSIEMSGCDLAHYTHNPEDIKNVRRPRGQKQTQNKGTTKPLGAKQNP